MNILHYALASSIAWVFFIITVTRRGIRKDQERQKPIERPDVSVLMPLDRADTQIINEMRGNGKVKGIIKVVRE